MDDAAEATRAFRFILIPMIATFAVQRFVLHHSPPETHVYLGGYLVHHLFTGALMTIPSAFLLAIGLRKRLARDLARIVLGVGSAMVLDEIVFLVCTDGSGVAYRNRVSFWGAFTLIALAAVFLLVSHVRSRRPEEATGA